MYHFLPPLCALVLQNVHLLTQRCSVQGPIWRQSQFRGEFKPTVTGPYLATHFPTRPRVGLTREEWGGGGCWRRWVRAHSSLQEPSGV